MALVDEESEKLLLFISDIVCVVEGDVEYDMDGPPTNDMSPIIPKSEIL